MNSELKDKRIWVPQVIVVIGLLGALNPNPYGYYVLLRLLCSGVFVFLTLRALEDGNERWAWILGITAVIYNPILRVHLTRDIWSVINLLTIGVAIKSIFVLKRRPLNADSRARLNHL